MEHVAFRAWLAKVDDLTADQRLELEEVLAGRTPHAAVTAAIEGSLGDEAGARIAVTARRSVAAQRTACGGSVARSAARVSTR